LSTLYELTLFEFSEVHCINYHLKQPETITVYTVEALLEALWQANKDHLHISNFDSKSICFTRVISLEGGQNCQKLPYFAKCNENNTYFSFNLLNILNVVTTCEFSICYKIIF